MIDTTQEQKTWGLGDVFLQPRQVVDLAYRVGVHDAHDLVISVAVCKAESQYGVKAWHDNLSTDGTKVISRDVGLWQINIPASAIGTEAEHILYEPITNAAAMFRLYNTRRFQPWAAYNSGVYLHDPYAGHAVLGVSNFLDEILNGLGATLPLPLFTTHDLAAKLR